MEAAMPFDGERFGKDIVTAVKSHLEKELEPLRERIRMLERRPTLRYEGVWQAGKTYQRGNVVTDAGSMWHANIATSARPGSDTSAWTLAVKRGRDGT
jgi:hypothetical protein